MLAYSDHCMLLIELSKIDLVPLSCCKRPSFDWYRIINNMECTKKQGGPPATKVGSPNEFLNYKVKARSAVVDVSEN